MQQLRRVLVPDAAPPSLPSGAATMVPASASGRRRAWSASWSRRSPPASRRDRPARSSTYGQQATSDPAKVYTAVFGAAALGLVMAGLVAITDWFLTHGRVRPEEA